MANLISNTGEKSIQTHNRYLHGYLYKWRRFQCMPLGVVALLRHSYGSCSIIICIPMGSCNMAREVVTRRTVLHHYCSTKIRFEPPTQSVTNSYI